MQGFRKLGSAAALVMISGAAMGQVTSGNIAGVVKDPTGAVVPNATVHVTSEATGVVVNAQTNSAGEYLVQNLLPNKYDISVDATGFSATTRKGVLVTLNATATADVSVTTGQASSVVEVNASTEVVLDTTTQNLTQTFSNQELSTLPTTTFGEGVLNASLLAPGVASSGGLGIGVGPSIGGQRPRSNNFMIEGIDNNNKAVTGPLVTVPNDAVGDFTLITNQFSPEFGHSAGGQFNTNIVTGTNQFHGRVYEYNQNRDLNAAGGIAGGKVAAPRYDNNRYGGQLGGPILRNKLFFFGNFERNTIGQTASYFLCTPTAGGLATLKGLGTAYGFSNTNLSQYLQYMPAATLTGPGGAGVDASVDNACGNQPSGAQFLTVSNLGAQSTNIPLGNYQVASPYFTNNDYLTTGVDWTISPTDSMRFRYIYNTTATTDTAANLPQFFTSIPYKYHLATISEFHNFTPNLINEVRIGFNRFYNDTPSGNFTYPGLDAFPNLTFYDQGYISVGPDENAPQFTVQNLYQLTDNVSWTKGKHTLRFGFDGRKYISPQGFTQRARGDYEWSELNQFLHDLAPDANGTAERSTGNHTYYGDQTALYGYANDTWRVSPKLTLNYGLRYEFTSVPTGERSQALNSVASVPGLINFHAPQPTYTSFFPRVGIVFAPDEKTSIRLGFGVAGDVLFDNLGTLSFPPQYSTTQDVGTGLAPAYGSANFLANGGLPAGSGSGVAVLDAATARAETSAYLPDQVVPYSENYTFTIQRNLTNSITAEIGYIGTRGIHLPTQIQYNVQPRVNANNVLPTYVNGQAIEAAGRGATNLADIQARSNILPQFAAAGFVSKITSYQPYSGSNYNGLIANLQGRTHGLQMNLSYTFSKTMDNATAEVFSTVLTPRRPQDSQNLNADYSRSALDRTHRITLEADYLFQPFKTTQNWVVRNVVGNWTIAPIYTYESPEYATVLSGVNSNQNGDTPSQIDRPLINPNGVRGTGSGVTPIVVNGQTVGYNATNPNAYYIQAAPGTLPTAGRNTLPIRPIDNVDASVFKRFTAFERYSLEFGAQAFNVLNHAQYQPGSVDNVNGPSYVASTNFQTVYNAFFNHPEKVFSNNARSMQLSAKFLF